MIGLLKIIFGRPIIQGINFEVITYTCGGLLLELTYSREYDGSDDERGISGNETILNSVRQGDECCVSSSYKIQSVSIQVASLVKTSF